MRVKQSFPLRQVTSMTLFFLLCIYIWRPAIIQSGSMQPNYPTHSHILMFTGAWGISMPLQQHQWITWRQPHRGVVVLFHNPHDHGTLWMKRVIGIAGDTILFRQHHLYINGIACTTPQHNYEHLPSTSGSFSPSYHIWASYLEQDWGPVHVPQGKIFLMGDNRGDSIDSRRWGSIDLRYLAGMPLLRW